MTTRQFELLSDADKDRIFQQLERQSIQERAAESKPLSARDRQRWKKFQERAKKHKTSPQLAKHAVKVIALTVDRDLLDRAWTPTRKAEG